MEKFRLRWRLCSASITRIKTCSPCANEIRNRPHKIRKCRRSFVFSNPSSLLRTSCESETAVGSCCHSSYNNFLQLPRNYLEVYNNSPKPLIYYIVMHDASCNCQVFRRRNRWRLGQGFSRCEVICYEGEAWSRWCSKGSAVDSQLVQGKQRAVSVKAALEPRYVRVQA